jgi:DNA-binding NarL/FixJ family response regulator
VVVVDDHEIVRAGLAAMLGRESDIHVVGTAEDGEHGLELVTKLRPEVAVVDYSLPRMSGVEMCEHIVREAPNTGVIVLSAFAHDEVILKSMQAGAKAYVCKNIDSSELQRAIRTVAQGGSVLDPRVTSRVMSWAHRRNRGLGDDTLSLREIEVLRLVARGCTNRDIAASLHVSENTVKTYLRRALEKLNSHTRSEAAAIAARRGLL